MLKIISGLQFVAIDWFILKNLAILWADFLTDLTDSQLGACGVILNVS